MNIIPELTTRSLFLGQTGSGKTFVIIKIIRALEGLRQIQILDSKGDKSFETLGAPIVDRLAELAKYKFPEYPIVVYRPTGEELANPEFLDAWCQWLYDSGHIIGVIDELTQLSNSTQPKKGFLNLYTRGRSRDCTIFAGTQRPAGVPRIVFTESQYIYRFYLSDIRDRNTVVNFSHPDMINNPKGKYGFLLYKVGDRKVYSLKRVS